MTVRHFLFFVGLALVGMFVSRGIAAPIYSDDFNTDTSANYNVYVTPGSNSLPSGDATFAYDYGAAPASGGLAIPPAPHTTDGSTLGLRVRTDNLQSSFGTIVGATEVVTKNLTLPSQYKVRVDVWSNYIGSTGGIASSGSNGSTGVAVGIGTAGTSIQYIANNDGILAEGFGDNGGGANGDYRIYVSALSPRPTPTNSSYYAAGTGANSATNTDPYYSFMGSVMAPSAQSTFASTQAGTSAVGTLGFAWHTFTIEKDLTNITWSIDGHVITTVPVSDVTAHGGLHGDQVSLGNDDTGLSGNSAANNQLFNAQIFDNLTIVPEPASAGLLLFGLAGFGLARRRSRRGV
jgi:hypothetical protein